MKKSFPWIAAVISRCRGSHRRIRREPAFGVHAVVATLSCAAAMLLAVGSLPAAETPTLALPWPAKLQNEASSYQVLGPTEFLLAAPAGTDLFISPDGKFRTDRSPRLLVRPDGPFILTARIQPGFKTKWDAGALVLFNDPEHFAKFCFEQDFQGTPRVVSVVCNGVADDCNSEPIAADAIFFRIAGSVPGDTFTFYSSPDGKKWFPVRSFRLLKTDALRIGFSAQSPVGPGCTVRFSGISLERRAPRDSWLGD